MFLELFFLIINVRISYVEVLVLKRSQKADMSQSQVWEIQTSVDVYIKAARLKVELKL